MFDAHLTQDLGREDTGGEGSTENVGEFLVETTDAHGLEVEATLEQTAVAAAGAALDTDGDVLLLLEEQGGGLDELTARTTEDFLGGESEWGWVERVNAMKSIEENTSPLPFSSSMNSIEVHWRRSCNPSKFTTSYK